MLWPPLARSQTLHYTHGMSPQIVIIGFTCRDTNIFADGTQRSAVGGKAYYMAAALHALGVPIHVITWVAETDGDLLEPYQRAGIPVTNLPVTQSIQYTNRYMDPAGNVREQDAVVPPFALHLNTIPDEAQTCIRQASYVALGTDLVDVLSETFLEQLRTTTRAAFAVDFGTFLRRLAPDGTVQHAPEWPDHLPYGLLDIAVLSSEEVPMSHREQPPDIIAQTLFQRGLHEVLVTIGSRGSVLATPDGTYTVDPYPVTTVDPTGAGDTFTAAYLAERSRGASARASAAFASAAAAVSITQYGPLTADRDTVLRFMQS